MYVDCCLSLISKSCVLTIAGLESPAIETDISTIRSMYETNVYGPMEMNREFLPLLLHTKGTIVNIASGFHSRLRVYISPELR